MKKIQNIVAPNVSSGGIIGNLPKALKYIMDSSCSDLGVPADIGRELAAIMAANLINGNEKDSAKEFMEKVRSIGVKLKFPDDLFYFMDHKCGKNRYSDVEIIAVYIRTHIFHVIQMSKLESMISCGQKKVSIMTCGDERVCKLCKKNDDKTFLINKAPELPRHWGCRCTYIMNRT